MDHVFGPVVSRRLGLSLGVDVIPYKTCPLDCIYCECGATTNKTSDLKDYALTEKIIKELDKILKKNPKIDYVTFSGSGEPTLNSGLGKIIEHLKKNYPGYKVAVITNSCLLIKKEVRDAILHADLVVPSFDAASKESFEKINKPVSGIKLDDLLNGLIEFRKIFKGQIWLEIFIVPGINDSKKELELLKKDLAKIMPNRIQLNSLDRPGVDKKIRPATDEELLLISDFFKSIAPVDIVKRKQDISAIHNAFDMEETILPLLKRRPSTIHDIAAILGRTQKEILPYLEILLKKKIITKEVVNKVEFYKIN